MFVWMKKRYLYSDDTVGASLDETWSAYKSGKHTNLSGSSLKKRLWDSWWQRRGFHAKVLYQKVVFFNQGVFLCEFSLGRRLHTRKTKKWVSVRKLALWPEDVRWQRELQLDAAAVLWGGVLNLVTPFLHLQLWKSSTYSSFFVFFIGFV